MNTRHTYAHLSLSQWWLYLVCDNYYAIRGTVLSKSDILQGMSNRKKNAKKTAANLGSEAKQVLADAFKEHHPAVYHKPAKRKY